MPSGSSFIRRHMPPMLRRPACIALTPKPAALPAGGTNHSFNLGRRPPVDRRPSTRRLWVPSIRLSRTEEAAAAHLSRLYESLVHGLMVVLTGLWELFDPGFDPRRMPEQGSQLTAAEPCRREPQARPEIGEGS